MGKQIVFRLTEKRTPASWCISGGFAIKEGKGRKLINYYPGSDSHFVEDQTSDIPAQEVVFTYNDILSDPATEIVVDEDNKSLVSYLKAHPFFNERYKIHDEEELSKEKSANYDKISEAFSLIQESDEFKIQAIAIAILGMEAYGWSAAKCSATLKETATKNPDVIISKANSDNYESFLLSALAFGVGIVKEDVTGNEVIWNDNTQGVILRLAKGENGIEKLGDMLSDANNKTVLQEIGIRMKKYEKTSTEKGLATEDFAKVKIVVNEQARQIEELKAQLALASSKQIEGVTVTNYETVEPTKKLTLEEAQKAYIEQEKKDLPPAQKNNLDWILSKLNK
ncbi:ABC transporter permease [Flavobacterium psychrophilum]|uniref:Uncharacterized protein n=1 Tax=Flavobacterium psychrophilum TaxID=96345 RepID=A0A7U2NEE8_FLAPS|nr:hypothetical protein [Flavobacterium psychrophilum]QRE03510.1 hypothetical protein H0H26_11560 [Flavobacterium psychrophilum]